MTVRHKLPGEVISEEIARLRAEADQYREALEFYAEKANWRTASEGLAAQYDRESAAAVKDGGIRARLALMSQLDPQKQ